MTDLKLKPVSREPKILWYDIETSLQTAAIFQLGGNDWIRPENLLSERYVISICWQWSGESKIHSVSLLDDPKRFAKDHTDDKHVLEVFHKIYSQADCTVAHYGDSFDKKYIMTRMLKHGLEPLPPVPSIDTKKVVKQQFYFNSNSLDYVGKFLGLGGKINTPGGLWLTILKEGSSEKAIKAIQTMVVYNKRDVALLKDVYHRVLPYIPNRLNRELFGQKEGCPTCGSKKVQSRGTQYAITRSYRRFQCQAPNCRSWFRILKTDKNSSTKHRVL